MKVLWATLCVICFFVGFTIFLFTNPLTKPLATSTATNIYNTIITKWNTIPDPVKGIITLGIPSLFAIFFAWTKTRAIQKLNETQQLANQKITQVEGEKRELEAQLQGVTETGKSYSASTVDGIKGLATELKDTKDLLSEKQQEILDWKTQEEVWIKTRGRLEGDIKYYKKELETLQEKYDLATGTKKAPVA